MAETIEQLYVTDRDIFDVLMSSRQRLTQTVLHDLTQDRRVFCSHRLSREHLADYVSALPHDYNDLATLLERRDPSNRGEKTTFIEIPSAIPIEDVKAAIEQYAADTGNNDSVTIPTRGMTLITAIFDYDEFDYSKTRLTQKQHKQAQIEVISQGQSTIIRMPANDKARSIVDSLRTRLEAIKKSELPASELSLHVLNTPDLRTKFFTRLISSIEKHQLQTVIGLKVASFEDKDEASGDDFDEDLDKAQTEILTIVRNVSLSGENLIGTAQYQALEASGFFIVSIIWRAVQLEEPGDLVQFDVSFERPVEGEGIKYSVRYAARAAEGKFSKSFKRFRDIRESAVFKLVEAAALAVLKDLSPQIEAVGAEHNHEKSA